MDFDSTWFFFTDNTGQIWRCQVGKKPEKVEPKEVTCPHCGKPL